MRGHALSGWRSAGRVLLHVVGWCALCLTLLTCKPPGFTPDVDPLTISPLQPEVVAGSQIVFSAAGGTEPYRFTVTAGFGSINTGSGLFQAPPSPGTTTVKVTDGGGQAAQTTVKIDPSDLVVSPSSISMYLGSSIVITASGGTPGYTGSVDHGQELTIASADTWTLLSKSTGDHTVTITDGAPTAKIAYCWVHVDEAPTALTISPKTLTLRVGDTFSFNAGGGTEPYHFEKASGVNAITDAGLYTASEVTAGTADVIRVTDSKDPPGVDTAEVTVNPLPLQIVPSSINLPFRAGQDFDASGGKPPYVFSMIPPDSPCGTIDPVTGVFTALSVAGTVTVRVDDSDSSTASTASVDVYAPLAIGPEPATVDAASTITMTASGGIPGGSGYAFTKVSGVGDVDEATGVYTAPATPGSAVVRVTDSIGNIDQTTVTVVDPAAWSTPIDIDTIVMDTTVGARHVSLVVAAADTPHVAYQAGNRLKYAKGTGPTTFAAQIVSTSDPGENPGQYASLALDIANLPRISCYFSKISHAGLGYSEWDGSSWNPSGKIPDNTDRNIGQYSSLALDPTDYDHPRIAYYDATTTPHSLKYAFHNGTTWSIEVVDSGVDVGRFASLRLTSNGYPRIAYYDAGGNLKYAWKDTGQWMAETVDAGGVGQYASLRLDDGNSPHIAYYDAAAADLKYVSQSGGFWGIPETIDSAGDVGKFASLALYPVASGPDLPRIAYYDATSANLKYASWNGEVWVVATIASAGDVGYNASLDLAPSSGKMRIAYYDLSVGKLKYLVQQ